MSDEIRVNFARPMPLFPLPDFVLLPHAVHPLHIFETRYCRMIGDCLDQAGQIAMACLADQPHDSGEQCQREIRPAVCIGQIVQHEPLPQGRHIILLHGVCRARIVQLIEPPNDAMYRAAVLQPLEPVDQEPPEMPAERRRLRELLQGPRLSRMTGVSTIMDWFERDDVATHALLELIGFAVLKNATVKYQLLAEASPRKRAMRILSELQSIDAVVHRAEQQNSFADWPKGMSWN